jgi:hypothetical protein
MTAGQSPPDALGARKFGLDNRMLNEGWGFLHSVNMPQRTRESQRPTQVRATASAPLWRTRVGRCSRKSLDWAVIEPGSLFHSPGRTLVQTPDTQNTARAEARAVFAMTYWHLGDCMY